MFGEQVLSFITGTLFLISSIALICGLIGLWERISPKLYSYRIFQKTSSVVSFLGVVLVVVVCLACLVIGCTGLGATILGYEWV